MKRSFRTGLLIAALAMSGIVHAQTLRWASQGDPQTMDPHSQNESMTNMMNGQVYERLIRRDQNLNIVPGLATEWAQTGPLTWRFKLRQGVKFHDGTPLTADDVVFSIKRGQEPTSQINNYATAVGEPVKIDESTVEFRLKTVNPVFLQHLDALWIMSKSWSEKHKVTKPLDYKNKEETYASMNMNGTGPYILASRAPGIKTTYKRNPNWWGKNEGNVQEIVYTPIANDATRLAALVSGEIDFVLDPAPRDIPRLRNTPGVKVIDGPENRVVFIGMDQGRDELLYSSVKGKNPFKDLRVRKALYHAIDIEAMKTKLMNNMSVPHRRLDAVAAGVVQRLPTSRALALRHGPGQEADGRGRLRRRLRGDARLPEQPLHQRRGDLHRAGVDVGATEDQGQGQRHAARDLLPQAREARHQHVHARLGWRRHRCRDHADAGAAQPWRKGRGRLQLRQLEERQVRRAGGSVQHRGRREEARGDRQGRAQGIQGQRAHTAAASPDDPLGRAHQRECRAPRRQLVRDPVGDDRQVIVA
jgi:hypothetical protein